MSELRSIAEWTRISSNGGKIEAGESHEPDPKPPALEDYQVKTVRKLGGLLIEEPEA